MQIRLNGNDHSLPAAATLAHLVQQLQLGERRYAIEVNDELIPRGEHAEHQLNEGDRVEIVQAIGGG